jgi:hypothetical protein
MMAADEQTTIPATAEWTSRSDAERHHAVDMLLRDPLWSLLADEAIANIAETSPDVVRDHRRALGNTASLSTYGEGDLP